MAGNYLVGPDGLRVEAVWLDHAHLAVARLHHPEARAGESWFVVTRAGGLVGYFPDVEALGEIVELADLHGPGEAASEAG
jgi:hypothetical protein